MKKAFLLAAIAALTACSSEQLTSSVGDTSSEAQNGALKFGAYTLRTTRAGAPGKRDRGKREDLRAAAEDRLPVPVCSAIILLVQCTVLRLLPISCTTRRLLRVPTVGNTSQ